MLITADQIMGWHPCEGYPRERVQALVGDGLTPRQVAELPIPPCDRYWALTRAMRPRDQRLAAAAIAERALLRARVTDARLWAAVRVARLYAMGEATYAGMYAARVAAWDAAWDAAGDVAWAAAWYAARGAACDAAWAAAGSAARDVAWAAAIGDAVRLMEADDADHN